MPGRKSKRNLPSAISLSSKDLKPIILQSKRSTVLNITARCVPERYIQEPKYRPVDSLISHDSTGIPVINMSLLAQGDADELQKLDFACNDWGFFQMTHHRVAEEVLSNMKTAVATFFDLPLEEKKYAMAENDVQGYGQGYIVSEEQKLDWCDLSFLMTYPDKHKNFKKWPLTVPGFKNSVEKYSTEINKLAEEVFALFSLLLGLERESLQKMHGKIRLGTRMNYYPSCSRPDLVVGVSPHSDGSSLTFLLQDDEITGLQSKQHKGWVPVKPIPNAIVVNIGDFVESWSNGLYNSIEHRAVTSEEKARISIATFVLPEDETIIGPVPRGVASCQPQMYKSIKYVDYIRYSLPRKMDGKANIEYLKV